ncbi:MAG TPA: 16S rRNA (cytidine(1402)-2'-O)-methyltransferase [Bryobacteraceae bacterium]|nr:16S rRNA (cytidine(1402)-2'-O)-methyltransferase [Bryobacteraceae bacterium]
MAAALYLVATPIGNLEDITLRALRILREEVDVIACEDTRQTQKLLTHYEIRKPLISYHEHNETSRTGEILERLGRGESIALVSDAGTPLISDPGYRVVAAALAQGLAVVPIPGPSAVLTALSASGLPMDEFRFIGFLPAKAVARRNVLEGVARNSGTVIAYESPHRILESLADISKILGERPMVLARELTKIHEEFLRGTPDEIRSQLSKRESIKGEITLLIAQSEEKDQIEDPLAEISRLEGVGFDRMEAIKNVAKRMGLPKREIYRLAAASDSNRPGKHRG